MSTDINAWLDYLMDLAGETSMPVRRLISCVALTGQQEEYRALIVELERRSQGKLTPLQARPHNGIQENLPENAGE